MNWSIYLKSEFCCLTGKLQDQGEFLDAKGYSAFDTSGFSKNGNCAMGAL